MFSNILINFSRFTPTHFPNWQMSLIIICGCQNRDRSESYGYKTEENKQLVLIIFKNKIKMHESGSRHNISACLTSVSQNSLHPSQRVRLACASPNRRRRDLSTFLASLSLLPPVTNRFLAGSWFTLEPWVWILIKCLPLLNPVRLSPRSLSP